MDYLLTEFQQEIRDLAWEITQNKIIPVARELDENNEFPHEIMKVLAQSDFFRLFVPEKYGGMVEDGKGMLELCLVTEQLARGCGGVAVTYAATALGIFPVILYGNEEQKKKYLPRVADGALAAFAVTEPAAGSDISAIQTTARKEGNYYVLNGTKHFITNGGEADIYVVIAMTNKAKGPRGASAFILEKGMPGFEFGKKEDKMGIRASVTRELIFNECKVPKENLLGREGMGFIITLKTFDMSRPGVAAQALGIAQGAFDVALDYVRKREQFGRPISSFQGIQWMLADMATKIEAARALVYSVARMADAGRSDIAKESAMAKMFASDVAMEVTTDAVQLLGGYGYMKEYPVEKFMRDAKITQIYEGTNQIQRNVIAQHLIKEALK